MLQQQDARNCGPSTPLEKWCNRSKGPNEPDSPCVAPSSLFFGAADALTCYLCWPQSRPG